MGYEDNRKVNAGELLIFFGGIATIAKALGYLVFPFSVALTQFVVLMLLGGLTLILFILRDRLTQKSSFIGIGLGLLTLYQTGGDVWPGLLIIVGSIVLYFERS
ncbi:MAG: hypothetical protein ACPL1Z_03155 [Candidatus Bathyarchaeales archaeon]